MNASVVLQSVLLTAPAVGVQCRNSTLWLAAVRFVDAGQPVDCACTLVNSYNYCHWPLGLTNLGFGLALAGGIAAPLACALYCLWSVRHYRPH